MKRKNHRKAALRRDKGICAVTGIDCIALLETFNAELNRVRALPLPAYEKNTALMLVRGRLEALGFQDRGKGRLWDGDHHIALALGGADEMPNMVTLSQPAHKAKTKRDAAAIAKRRKHLGERRVAGTIPARPGGLQGRGFSPKPDGYVSPLSRRRQKR